MLSGLGMARFPAAPQWTFADAEVSSEGVVILRCGDERVVVPASPHSDGPGWWGIRRLNIGDSSWSVLLEDIDPLRDLAEPVGPDRLDQAAVDGWQRLLDDAWAILRQDDPVAAEALAAGVVTIAPLPEGDGWDARSASAGDAFGSIMVSPPSDAVTLAVALHHEFMHIKLGGLMHIARLTSDDPAAVWYAPWREDPRPVGGLLQGVYAFFGIADFWRKRRTSLSGTAARLADFEYAYARSQAWEGLRTVQDSGRLTAVGRRFADGLSAEMRAWSADHVTEEIDRLAGLVGDDHRSGWRIRHLRPDPDRIQFLGRAWLDGGTVSTEVPVTIVPDPAVRWSQPRLRLVRRRLAYPPQWTADDAGSGLESADSLLIEGRFSAATAVSRGLVGKDPEDLAAWTGLGLALRGTDDQLAAKTLLYRPDVVLALSRWLRAAGVCADPVDLASWVAVSVPDLAGPYTFFATA